MMSSPFTRSSTIGVGAALALVLGGLVAPAAAETPPSPVDLSRVLEPGEARSGGGVDPRAGIAGAQESGAALLESAPTVRAAAGAQAARPVKVVKRTGSLWMYRQGNVAPSPQQDLDRVEAVQDVAKKRIVVTATYDAAPTTAANSALFVFFGTWDAKEELCTGGVQLGAMAQATGGQDVGAFYMADGRSAGTATRQLSGSTLRITLAGGAAGASGNDCFYARSFGAADTQNPQLASDARDFKAEYEKAPKFDFYSSDLHAAYPGKWNKVTVTLRNEGDATARGLKVSARGAKVKLKKKTFKPGNLAPGKRKTVTLKVKLTGKKTRKLKVTAAATGGWKASTSTKVGHRPRPKKLASLSGRSYWANESVDRHGWTVHRLTFVNRSWVYSGASSKKVPACKAKVKGCQKYAYSRKTGALRIGKVRAKVDSEGIRVTKAAKKRGAKLNYQPLKTPKAGSRIAVKLKYTDFTGCGMTFSCSTWWQVLTLRNNGTFTRTYSAIHSNGMPGNQTMVSVSGPNPSGTYKLLKKGRIQFSYVDEKTKKRKTETHLIGIDSNVLGKFAPKHGLIVGADPYL